ncbi:MAG TPA: hypothetical protein VGS19_09260 [Streptosporangiaceae bacterium]|nr:hypothetical protein [Streptosporangiaceae bacterium]
MTVSLGYIFGGGTALTPPGQELYDRYEVMRQLCHEVSEWTQLDILASLSEDLTPPLSVDDIETQLKYRRIATMRQAFHSVGVASILNDIGVKPRAVTGSSLGGMIAASVAGAIDASGLFGLLEYISGIPLAPAGEPMRGIAFAFVPEGTDLDWYCEPSRPHVHLAADHGKLRDGSARVVLLSGYRDELLALAAEAPEETVVVFGVLYGGHSPLQQFVHDALEPYVRQMTVRDPEVPLFSSLRHKRLESADDVREDFLLNTTITTRTQHMVAGLSSQGLEIAATIGQAIPIDWFSFPFMNVNVAAADDIERLMYSLHDLGITLETGQLK